MDLNGETLDEWIKTELNSETLPSYCSTWIEFLEDEHYNEYYYHKKTNILYHIVKQNISPEDFIEVSAEPDGSYSFLTSFYNGAVNLSEMIEEGLDKIGESD